MQSGPRAVGSERTIGQSPDANPGGAKAPPARRTTTSTTRRGPIPDRVTLLADVAEIVSRSHDLSETLDNVVDLVAKRLDADACSIYLIEADMRKLTLSATIGLNREAVGRV